ncbi:unnamed protein product [Prorocentrum cordatum]|uniref:Uncharacterized protein n=1 Tax=Prorocentrum cordatum TaxID=2364126 RepID=A0ABN9RWN3_9DINO|nr:unnamed protein product [Polarella glacialis]
MIQVPDMLDCGSLPEWGSFRWAVSSAVAAGFERSPQLEAQASELEERWRPWVCESADDPDACRAGVGMPGFGFIRDLERECRDSNNFERYLLRHFFANTGKVFEPLRAPSGFCLYGYLTALVVLAWHALPDHEGEALRYFALAQHFVGHYHCFDFLESSTWPVTSFLVLLNMQAGSSFLALPEPPGHTHPGQLGADFYLERLRWRGTSEARKPNPGAAPYLPLPLDRAPAGWRGRGGGPERPRVSVWQFCIHTSTAGEAVTMIGRFLRGSYDVEFRGNSIAFQLCNNYSPSMCARGQVASFLEQLFAQFQDEDFT